MKVFRGYTHHHLVVFTLTFCSYALFHATRKAFSNIKSTIEDEWTTSFHNSTVQTTKPNYVWNYHHMFENGDDAEIFLGALDTAFLSSYAIGLFISGIVGDRLNMRLVLSFGMCSSAITVFIFGTVTEWIGLYNKYFYMGFWILNGLLQSTGWPTVVAIMGNWFGRSSRGLILGVWSSCASVGNIIGAILCASVLDYGYEYAFFVPAATLFAGGIVNFFGLVTRPTEVGLPETTEEEGCTTVDVHVYSQLPSEDSSDVGGAEIIPINTLHGSKRPEAISIFKAIMLPGVIPYSLAYACLKLVNYSFFFWLPFYLTQAFKWKASVADDISIWYDVGGIVGGILGGIISDHLRTRSPIVVVMLILAIPSLFLYSHSPANLTTNAGLMSVAGFFIGGPANLISAAISADLGRQGPIQGNTEALATVTGIVDGTGSVGAALGQIIVPELQERFDWQWVFYFFMLMTILAVVCLIPMVYGETKTLLSRFCGSRNCGRTCVIQQRDDVDVST